MRGQASYQAGGTGGDRQTGRWLHTTARTFGTLILVLAALILVAATVGAASRGFALPPGTQPAPPYTLAGRSMLAVALGVQVLGLALAWRRERLGGLLAIGGYLLKQGMLALDGGVPFLVFWNDVWLWPALAGLVYLVCWWRTHQGAAHHGRPSTPNDHRPGRTSPNPSDESCHRLAATGYAWPPLDHRSAGPPSGSWPCTPSPAS
jgi:hypothetical protein